MNNENIRDIASVERRLNDYAETLESSIWDETKSAVDAVKDHFEGRRVPGYMEIYSEDDSYKLEIGEQVQI